MRQLVRRALWDVPEQAEYEQAEKPTRQRLHFYLDRLSTGDKLDLLVYPRGAARLRRRAHPGGPDLGADCLQGLMRWNCATLIALSSAQGLTCEGCSGHA